MGKRRDRMLAAMSNAGRRVKLDLSAEPSGDMVGSTGSDEVGKDTESKERAGLPNSPSSSGQQQQNPLLLLGQYSDDEIKEESNERIWQAVADNSSADEENQVKGQFSEGSKDKDVIKGEDLASREVKQQDKDRYVKSPDHFQKPEVSDNRESHTIAVGQLHKETNFAEQNSVTVTSAVQVTGDVSSGWKVVLHEESNQYYYWNTETGETSWEVPQLLAQTAELTSDQKTYVNEDTQTTAMVTHGSDFTMGVEPVYYSTALTSDGSMAANKISLSKDGNECVPPMNEKVEASESEILKDANGAAVDSQIVLGGSDGAVDALSGNMTVTGSEMYIHGSVTKEEYKTGFDLPSDLVKRCEHLLERLKSLEGSKGHLQGHDWILKYVLEVEIRLSDYKLLSSHGLSLLPFWMYSERQIERLEGAINEEIYQFAKSQVDELVETHISSCGKEDDLGEQGHESQAEYQNDATFSALISNISSNTNSLTVVENDLHNEASFGIIVPAKNAPFSGLPTRQLENGPTIGDQVNGTVLCDESIPKPLSHAGEDVDMDVDMEVEDPIATGNVSSGETFSTKGFTPPKQPVQPNPSAEHPSLPSEDAFFVPPPPDEEWIPPPPPDNEQVPPPPPDEPPETSNITTTSYMETGQPLSYAEQYNLSYPNSGFTYYGHAVAEVPNSNLYGQADVSQVDMPHVPVYYGVVPNTYNGTTSAMVNPVQSVAYYGVQDGTIPSAPVASSVEPSQHYNESGAVSDNTLASDQIASLGALSEAEVAVKTDVSAVGGESDMGSIGFPSTSATIQAPASDSFKESASALSTNAITSATASAATTSSTTKVQSKVRNKKRTVAVATSLRSNKKVSSLVDKWKAAKEELNETEEDEPENAYEMLEKKRQREIEEWHAQQIASGEAKDNANFQPLGGDWREKVKRRRAQAAKEAAKTPPEAETDGNQQPNLVDLSKDLPSGWQAYWDETSKQVYYGNTITSETTWTRPKKETFLQAGVEAKLTTTEDK